MPRNATSHSEGLEIPAGFSNARTLAYPGHCTKPRFALKPPAAFTLIELILVMVLLLGAAALVTPKVAGFFNSRKVDSEAHRILSLTRYAQSRAVSEGIPVMLWVDVKSGTYGVRQETGYSDTDAKQVSYTADDNVRLGIDNGNVRSLITTKGVGIHFSPEGNIVTSTSVKGIFVQEGNHPALWIVPSINGLFYELRTDRNR